MVDKKASKKRIEKNNSKQKKTEEKEETRIVNLEDILKVLEFLSKMKERFPITETYRRATQELITGRYMEQTKANMTKVIKSLYGIGLPRNWDKIHYEIFDTFLNKKVFGYDFITFNRAEVERLIYPASILVTNAILQADKLYSKLSKLSPKARIEQENIVLELSFQNLTSINTLKDMEERAKTWRNIFTAFSRLTSMPIEDPKIFFVEHGSLIIFLLAVSAVITALTNATLKLMEVQKKRYEIIKLKREIELVGLKKIKALDEIAEEANKLVGDNIPKISDYLIKEHKYQKADKGEVRNHLNMALKDIHTFIDKGGEINIRGKLASKEPEVKKLFKNFIEIRQLRDGLEKLKALPKRKLLDTVKKIG